MFPFKCDMNDAGIDAVCVCVCVPIDDMHYKLMI